MAHVCGPRTPEAVEELPKSRASLVYTANCYCHKQTEVIPAGVSIILRNLLHM